MQGYLNWIPRYIVRTYWMTRVNASFGQNEISYRPFQGGLFYRSVPCVVFDSFFCPIIFLHSHSLNFADKH